MCQIYTMLSVKRIFAIEQLLDIHKKNINCFLFELEGESRYVTKRLSVRIQVHPKQLSCNFIGQLSLHHLIIIYL